MTSVIIVNWNTCEYLAQCLASVQECLPAEETETIVVDNASTDNSAGTVERQFPQVRVIANRTNKGFSGGVNDGLRVAHGDRLLILNPDIVLRKGVVEALARYLEETPGVGAVVPSLKNPDGSEQTGYFRRLPTLMQTLLFSTVLAPWSARTQDLVERYLEASRRDARGPLEVEQIPGAFLFTTRAVMDRVGTFDEAYRLFFEDVDWSSRAREEGLKLMMLPDLEVTHIGGRSFVMDDGTWVQARYFTSMVTYFRRRKGRGSAIAAGIILALNSLAVLVKNSLFRGWSDAGRRRRAWLSRRTHANILRVFFAAFVLRKDVRPLP